MADIDLPSSPYKAISADRRRSVDGVLYRVAVERTPDGLGRQPAGPLPVGVRGRSAADARGDQRGGRRTDRGHVSPEAGTDAVTFPQERTRGRTRPVLVRVRDRGCDGVEWCSYGYYDVLVQADFDGWGTCWTTTPSPTRAPAPADIL